MKGCIPRGLKRLATKLLVLLTAAASPFLALDGRSDDSVSRRNCAAHLERSSRGDGSRSRVSSSSRTSQRADGWNLDLILKIVTQLHAEGCPVNNESLEAARSPAEPCVLIISRMRGRPTLGATLVSAGKRLLPGKGWNAILDLAGIPLEERGARVYWTRELILEAIHELSRRGMPLNYDAVAEGVGVREALSQATRGLLRDPRSFLDASSKILGGWDHALMAAGLDPVQIRRNFSWTEGNILAAIRHLASQGYPLNRNAIEDTHKEELAQVLREFFEVPHLVLTSLVKAAEIRFQSWDRALQAAGFDPTEIRRWNPWRPQEILAVLQGLSQEGEFSLSYSNFFLELQPSLREGIFRLSQGKHRSARALLLAAVKHFGSWSEALGRAGVQSGSSGGRRLRGPLMLTPGQYQVERVPMENGATRRVVYLGMPPQRPDDLYLERQRSDLLGRMFMTASREQRDLVVRLLSALDESDRCSPSELAIQVSADGGPPVSVQQVEQAFATLRSAPDLRDMLE